MQRVTNKPVHIALHLRVSKGRITLLLILVVAFLHLLNIPAVLFRYLYQDLWLRDFYVSLFSVSKEGKIPTWYSSWALLFCAILIGLIAYSNAINRDRYLVHWVCLSSVFFIMSLDEAIAIHERASRPLRSLLNTKGVLSSAWVIPGILFVVILGLFYLRFLIDLPQRTRFLFVIAGVIYLGGVLGMEMVGAAYKSQYGATLTYGVIASVEEVLEMSGIVVFIYGLLDYLERYVKEMIITFAM